MENQKGNSSVVILLLLIIAVLLGGIIYFGIVKNDTGSENNQDDEIQESKEVKEELSLSDATVIKLYGYVNSNDRIEREYFNSNDELNRKTVSDEIKLRVAFASNGVGQYQYSSSSASGRIYTVDSNVVLNQINEIFGENNGYQHVQNGIVILSINCMELKYNQSQNVYELRTGSGCGDLTTYTLYTKLVKAVKTKDTIVLTEKMYVYSNENIYKDMKQTKLIASGITSDQAKNGGYFDNGATVTYTFQLGDNGTYYFDNSKITY